MRVADVCAVLERWAPPGLAYDGDPVGLNIGDSASRVTSVLVALTVTGEVLKAARRSRVEMIVSHHPVLWAPLRSLQTDDAATRLCLNLAQAGIACFSMHTNLDVAPGGVNDILAQRLGLLNTASLLPVSQAGQVKLVTFVPESHLEAVRHAVCDAGAGAIGEYTYCSFSAPGVGTFLPGSKARPFSGQKHRVNEEPERRFETLVPKARLAQVVAAMKKAHPYEEVAYDIVCLQNTDPSIGRGVRGDLPQAMPLDRFARTVREALRVSQVRVVGERKRKVRTVGIVGGSGGRETKEVARMVDVYVTGDVGYHEALEARERGLALIDAGHAGTEKWIVPAVARYLKRQFKQLRVVPYREPEAFRLIQKRVAWQPNR